MAFIPFTPPPGIISDTTEYTAKGSWYDCNLVRFRGGFPERIGGWTRLTSNTFDGVCRDLVQWSDLTGLRHIGVGTNLKYYVENGGGILNDITPLRLMTLPNNPLTTTNTSTSLQITLNNHGLTTANFVLISGAMAFNGLSTTDLNATFPVATVVDSNNITVVVPEAATGSGAGGGADVTILADQDIAVPLPNNPFTTTNTSAIVTVDQTNHGANVGDFVKFSGATAVGGLTITGEYQVTTVVSANAYTITAASPATSGATGGGSAVFAQYEIPVGPQDYIANYGWGAGGWGVGAWGSASAQGTGTRLRLWSGGNFGEDLIYNPRGGGIYRYSISTGATRGVDIRLQSDQASAPFLCNFVLTSAVDRRVFAFGCNDIGSTTLDPMLIRWSDSESVGDWFPTATNSAGSFRLSVGSEIKCAVNAVGEIIVFTDSGLVGLTMQGGGFVYGQTLLSPNIDIVSPGAAIAIDDAVFWMGKENFFMYSGRAMAMPCTVRQYVFSNINIVQADKIIAASNRLHREVWWFYPSANSIEIDSYVIFNYAENTWYYGKLQRTGWTDAGLQVTNPIGAAMDGYLYYHENGLDDGSTSPPSPISAYITSGPVELGSGDRLVFLRRVVPDITFKNSTVSNPGATYTFYPQLYPGSALGTPDTGSGVEAQVLAATTFEEFTPKINLRLRGRQFVFKVSSGDLGVAWRLGVQRFDAQPDGGR